MNILAYILALVKYIIYGTSVLFTGGLTESVDVLDVLALRFLMSFVVLWLLKVCRVFKIRVGIKELLTPGKRRKFIPTLVLAALFEPVLYMLFETLGIAFTDGVTTGVILSLMPISSVICEAIILKEKTTVLQKVFLGVGIVGVAYISICTGASGGASLMVLGIIFLILAVLCGSLFQVFSRKSSGQFTPMEITYFSCMLGATAFNTVNVVRHLFKGDILHYFDPYFDVENIIGFIFLAIISTIVATCMGNFSLGRMQASTMAAFSGVSTLTTIFVGVIFDGEQLFYFHYIGLSLILIRMIGVSVIAIRKDRAAKKPTVEIQPE
ncbi:MAG: DMT family transporter [Clostridia bacterium]|nr:DMT family transporter [Clostridia bacterium]